MCRDRRQNYSHSVASAAPNYSAALSRRSPGNQLSACTDKQLRLAAEWPAGRRGMSGPPNHRARARRPPTNANTRLLVAVMIVIGVVMDRLVLFMCACSVRHRRGGGAAPPPLAAKEEIGRLAINLRQWSLHNDENVSGGGGRCRAARAVGPRRATDRWEQTPSGPRTDS